MSNNLYAPFYNATAEVFQLLLDTEISANKGEKSLLEDQDVVSISIGVIGDLEGEIIYFFPKGTALKMVEVMSGMELEELDAFVTSALGEIANIISGNAMTGLTEQNLTCDILPPKVVVGACDNVDCPTLQKTVQSPIGDLELIINIKAGAAV